MSLLSIVALIHRSDVGVDDRLAPFRAVLERMGHEVECLATHDGRHVSRVGRGVPGLADVAVRGLKAARGEVVVLIDLERPYTPDDLEAVAGPLLRGETDVAVGCPGRARLSARLLAPIARTVDPWSGLVGVRREAILRTGGRLRPVGERFALEIAQRVEGGRRDVPLPDRPGDRPRGWHLDDVRHLKRLADDRLGMVSRLAQFCVVGASGMVVDLSCYAALQWRLKGTSLAEKSLPILGFPLDLALAGLLSVTLALLWNFSLNRRLTFNDARRRSIGRQFATYALGNALGICLSLTLRLSLPEWFGFFERHKLAAAVVGIAAGTGVSFTMARWFVFPHDRARTGPAPMQSDEESGEVSPAGSTSGAV